MSDVEYWRNTTLRELSLRIVEIQNPLVEDVKLQDLNDQIDQLVKDKFAYETRIVELGGKDYRKSFSQFLEKHCLTTLDGKRYYGRAKELIKDKNLIPSTSAPSKPSRQQLASQINGSYFGGIDEIIYPDLLEEEAAKERELAQRESSDFLSHSKHLNPNT